MKLHPFLRLVLDGAATAAVLLVAFLLAVLGGYVLADAVGWVAL